MCFSPRAIEELLKGVDRVNAEIAKLRPWENGVDRGSVVEKLKLWIQAVYTASYWFQPFVPSVGPAACSILETNPIRKPETLFPRL